MLSHRHTMWRVAFVLLALMAVSCAPAAIDLDSSPTPSPQPPTTDPAPSPQPGQGSPLDRAVADLAARLNVPASEIEIVSEEAVVWPDAGLGCPQPGVSYIQIMIEGHRIVLAHGDQMYDYHAGGSSVILCEQANLTPQPLPQLTVVPITPTAVIEQGGEMKPTPDASSTFQPLVEQAVADLADRLSIDPAEIEVATAEAVVWPDTSLGCPRPDMQYLQVLTEGFRIELRVKDRVYAYHGGRGRGPFLCETPAQPPPTTGNPNA